MGYATLYKNFNRKWVWHEERICLEYDHRSSWYDNGAMVKVIDSLGNFVRYDTEPDVIRDKSKSIKANNYHPNFKWKINWYLKEYQVSFDNEAFIEVDRNVLYGGQNDYQRSLRAIFSLVWFLITGEQRFKRQSINQIEKKLTTKPGFYHKGQFFSSLMTHGSGRDKPGLRGHAPFLVRDFFYYMCKTGGNYHTEVHHRIRLEELLSLEYEFIESLDNAMKYQLRQYFDCDNLENVWMNRNWYIMQRINSIDKYYKTSERWI